MMNKNMDIMSVGMKMGIDILLVLVYNSGVLMIPEDKGQDLLCGGRRNWW